MNAAKPYADYEKKIGGKDNLYMLFQKLGQALFTQLVNGLYPDQVRSLNIGLSLTELQRTAGLTAPTLASLREVNAEWIKNLLRVVDNVNPAYHIQQAPNTVNQTAIDLTLANHLITEVNAANNAPRNLIFDNGGRCVAEINFSNHGGTATSGHAHIYPVKSMPIAGHHVSGVPTVEVATPLPPGETFRVESSHCKLYGLRIRKK